MNRRWSLGMIVGTVGFFLSSIFALVLLEGVGICPNTRSNEAMAASAAAGLVKSEDVAPDFELSDLNGSSVRLSKFKGDRPVLLYFWATWCPYCIAAKPQIAQLREKFAQKEMEIFGINVGEGDSLERLKRFQEGHPVTWPILYDTGGKVSRTYHVQGIPLFILVDKEGNVVYRSTSPPANPREYLQ
jgi:peroxiredoxin